MYARQNKKNMFPHQTKNNLRYLKFISRCITCHNHIKIKIKSKDKFLQNFCSQSCEDNHKKGLNKCRTCKAFKKCMICSKCKIGYYCCRSCQIKDWSKHKYTCDDFKNKKKKFENKLYVGNNEWVSVNKLKGLEYVQTENVDLFFRYAKFSPDVKLQPNCLLLKESTMFIYYKLKGIYKKFVKDIRKQKMKLKNPIIIDGEKITHKIKFPCVEAVVLENDKVLSTTCSIYGIVEQVFIKRIKHTKTGKESWFTLPLRGSFHNLVEKAIKNTCTIGVHISELTHTKPGVKYKLILRICEKHCKINDDIRNICVFDIYFPKNQKSKTMIYEPQKKRMECCICLDLIIDDNEHILQCGHIFCHTCMEKWKTNCPLCRKKQTK